MTGIPPARPIPGLRFEAKARRKKTQAAKSQAATCTPAFEQVRPFLSGKRLRGLNDDPDTEPAPPAAAPAEKPAGELTEIWSEPQSGAGDGVGTTGE